MRVSQQPISPEHLQTLFKITQAMNSTLDFDEVLHTVIDSMMEVCNAQRGFLMVADEDGQLELRIARGLRTDEVGHDVPYSATIVNQVIQTRETLLTNNAMYDENFMTSGSIVAKGIRAILCAPMIVNGRLIGAVYVDTLGLTNFTDSDRDLLSAVAGQAGVAIENARLYTVAVEKGRLERELQMAREIQEGLLPKTMPHVPGYELAARWEAAREVAGDFYDAFHVDDDEFGIVIADVSDKGAAAAMFMAVARTLIRTHAQSNYSPVETLSRTNDLILDDAQNGMFVTVYYSVFMPNGHSIHVNAGHNPPMLYRAASNEVSMMAIGGRAIGWFPNNPLQDVEVDLQPGDVIVYYTDGVTEAENIHGEFFGEARLQQAIIESAGQHADIILKHIVQRVDEFVGEAAQFDDLTLFVLRYTG
ncbi:MAG: GAF domain-containing protein [Chloroflexi bacterium]|nr:MAG: GAF domain-containing protein [Chloroflexota bacterium]